MATASVAPKTMPPTPPDLPRPIQIAAIVAVIAIPIALVVATWRPLEPLSRATRTATFGQEGPGERTASPRSEPQEKSGSAGVATPALRAPTPPSED